MDIKDETADSNDDGCADNFLTSAQTPDTCDLIPELLTGSYITEAIICLLFVPYSLSA